MAASDAYAAVVNPNDIATLLTNGVSTFFSNVKTTFIKVPIELCNLPFLLLIF